MSGNDLSSVFEEQNAYAERLARAYAGAIDGEWTRLAVDATFDEDSLDMRAVYWAPGDSKERAIEYSYDGDTAFRELADAVEARGKGRPKRFRFTLDENDRFELKTDYGEGFV